MRVVVTGGAGFIGANTVRALLSADAVTGVTVVDDLSSGSAVNLRGLDRVELVRGSILDAPLLCDVVAGSNAIVHLAARPSVPGSVADPVGTHAVNATGTLLVLDAARLAGGVHTIIASSSAVYGDDPTPHKHEDLAPRPLSPYAADKLASEASAAAYAAAYGLPTLTFRFFNVFGPLQPPDHVYAAVVPAFASAALEGRPLHINGDGRQTRDFVYVGDVARVLASAAVEKVTSTRPVNLATGSIRTLLDLVDELEQVLGRRLERTHGAERPGDVRHSSAERSQLRHLFPELRPLDFADALRATVDWLRDRAGIAPDVSTASSDRSDVPTEDQPLQRWQHS